MNSAEHDITRVDPLEALLDSVAEASMRNVVDHVHPHYRALIAASPSANSKI